jgi:hypothetical protein
MSELEAFPKTHLDLRLQIIGEPDDTTREAAVAVLTSYRQCILVVASYSQREFLSRYWRDRGIERNHSAIG